MEIRKVRSFTSDYDYTAFSVVRLHSQVIKELGGRNTWVKISNSSKCIYRLALGKKPSAGFNKNAMELDYDSLVELNFESAFPKDENEFFQCEFSVKKARFPGKFIAHWKHPNPAYRVPIQISIVSLILGMIGLMLGFISLV